MSSNDDDLQERVEALKSGATAEEIELILKLKELGANEVYKFQLTTILLNHTIPDVYTILPRSTQNVVKTYLTNIVGLGNILRTLGLLQNGDKLANKAAYAQILVKFVSGLFRAGITLELRAGATVPELKELNKLVFKGTCFSMVNECCLSMGLKVSNDIFVLADNYSRFLYHEILILLKEEVKPEEVKVYYLAATSFKSGTEYFLYEIMFARENYHHISTLLSTLKKFEVKQFLFKLLTSFVLKRYLKATNSEDKMVAVAFLVHRLFLKATIDDSFAETLVPFGNPALFTIFSSSLDEKVRQQLITSLMNSWRDENYIKNESIKTQENMTLLLIHLLSSCEEVQFLSKLMGSSVFLDGVSRHLSSFSPTVKSLGVILADKLCELTGSQKIFDMSDITSQQNYLVKQFPPSVLATLSEESAWDYLAEPDVLEVDDEINKKSTDKSTSLTFKPRLPDSDDESDFGSDEEDDPSIARKSRVLKPLYIKDLVKYITLDHNDAKAYDSLTIALKTGPTLIRQKAKFGDEVALYSEELLSSLIGLTNRFDEPDFEDWRLQCLVALCCSNPDIVPFMYQLLLTGDYSLQQRMCILSAASLSARELRGIKDDIIAQSYTPKLFPSKILPHVSHSKFLPMSDNTNGSVTTYVDHAHKQLQSALMSEVSEKVKDKDSIGKIVKISERVKKPRSKAKVSAAPNFFKIVGTKFYFPLISVWNESGGIDIGQYSPILISHYIKTVALILHSAHPISGDIQDMIREYFIIASPLLQQTRLDHLQVIESLVAGFFLICDIADEQYLIIQYVNELTLVQRWLTLSWESITDDKIKSLCAGLLIRLDELNERYKRKMLDAVNSMY